MGAVPAASAAIHAAKCHDSEAAVAGNGNMVAIVAEGAGAGGARCMLKALALGGTGRGYAGRAAAKGTAASGARSEPIQASNKLLLRRLLDASAVEGRGTST